MLSDRIAAARLSGRYKFLTVPYCTKHTGTKAPPKACPGPLGRPYKGYIWSRKDPNAAGNKDQCTGIKPQNVCADQKTLCSTAAQCRMCKADGSMAVFTSTTGKLFGNLEVQKYVSVDECKANAVLLLAVCLHLCFSHSACSIGVLVCGWWVDSFDAWLGSAGGCDGAASPTGAVSAGNLQSGVACQDGGSGTGYILYSEMPVRQRFTQAPPHAQNAEHFVCVKFAKRPASEHNRNCPKDCAITSIAYSCVRASHAAGILCVW
jgi:hypothetical protein|eukprot:COSAG01_NODE_3221_length_6395_cov_15.338945_10_plen_263_part_00